MHLRPVLLVFATALMCAGLISTAALDRPPPGALAAIVLACVVCPMLAGKHLPALGALVLRRPSLVRLRRQLDELPEIEHPLGL